MGTIGTFGSFTQARLGIYAAQQGMSVTGNNIANINTPGYTRQRLDQVSIPGSSFDRYASHGVNIGYGTMATSVSQLRDPYLDIRFRDKLSDLGAMEAKLGALSNINDVLNEVGKGENQFGIIGAQFDDLIHCLEQISDQTGQANHDNLVRGSAEALCRKLNSYANQLKQVQENMDAALRENVKVINENLRSIRDLNETIRKCDIHGDNALELRDKRNELIDQLSELIKVDVTYEMEDLGGGLMVEKLKISLADTNPDQSVTTDSTVLVDGIYAGQLTMPDQAPKLNPHYDPNEQDPANPGFGKYLMADPNDPAKFIGTNDKDKAALGPNENYNMGVTELRDKYDKVLRYIDKLKNQTIPAPAAYDAATLKAQFPGIPDAELAKINNAATLAAALRKYPSHTDPNTGITTIYKDVTDDLKAGEVVTSTPSVAYDLDDNDLYGVLQAQREFLTEKGEFTDKGTVNSVDEGAAGKRGIQFYQRALDALARQVADSLNGANNGFLYDEKGNFLNKTDGPDGKPVYTVVDSTGYQPPKLTVNENREPAYNLVDGNGQVIGTISVKDYEQRIRDSEAGKTDAQGNAITIPNIEREAAQTEPLKPKHSYTEDEAKFLRDKGAHAVGGNLFSNRGDNNDGTGITAANISIAHDWSNGPMIVRSYLKPEAMDDVASTDSSNITHIITLFDTKMDYLPSEFTNDPAGGGEAMFHGTFTEMWNKIGTTLGDDMKFTNTMAEVYNKSAVELDMQRASASSVDLNDEAMNLMQYSKSYNAACRLMTTLDSMLDKLINGTGLMA